MKTILAAIDFSDASNSVLAMAKSLAKVYGAKLHLLHIIEPQTIYSAYGFAPEEFPAIQIFEQEATTRAIARMDELKKSLEAESLSVTSHVAAGVPLNALLDYAKEHAADLVVLGAHSHNAISSLLAGSLAGSMARKAEVSTLIVPAPVA